MGGGGREVRRHWREERGGDVGRVRVVGVEFVPPLLLLLFLLLQQEFGLPRDCLPPLVVDPLPFGSEAFCLAVALSFAEYLACVCFAACCWLCEATRAASIAMVASAIGGGRVERFFGWMHRRRSASCPRFPPPFHGPMCLTVHGSVRPSARRSA